MGRSGHPSYGQFIQWTVPPYNTGHDFVYDDDFAQTRADYDTENGELDEEGGRLVANPESNGRFHSDWCSMIYPRLLLARDLLSEDGAIFISIDDNEVANVTKICDEIFGASCFVCNAIWRSSDNSNNDAKQFSNNHNYTLIYSKMPGWRPELEQDEAKRKHFANPDGDPRGPWFDGNPLNSPNYRENLRFDIPSPNGGVIHPPKNGWRWSRETLKAKMVSGEIYFNKDGTGIKRRTYLADMKGLPPSSLWTDLEKTGHNRQAKYELLELISEDVFDTTKPVKLINYIIGLVPNSSDCIVVDFFSGSATTAEAVMRRNASDFGSRSFICIQYPDDLDDELSKASNDKKARLRNAIGLCDELGEEHVLSVVGEERIRRAGEKIKGEVEEVNRQAKIGEEPKQVPDIGFRVFRVDSSNFQDVRRQPDQLGQQQLSLFTDNLKPDRTAEDLLFQVLPKFRIPYSAKTQVRNICGKKVFDVNDGQLMACLDVEVGNAVIEAIARMRPLYAVFRDASMANDATEANFEELFKTYSPDTIRRVI
jgi:adenine-specific DNA-methyltransferase